MAYSTGVSHSDSGLQIRDYHIGELVDVLLCSVLWKDLRDKVIWLMIVVFTRLVLFVSYVSSN